MGLVSRIPEDPGLSPLKPSPVRILIQTLTHLAPSDGVAGDEDPYGDRLISMLDRICKHTWDVEFEPGVHRWYTSGDEFGYNNRPCFFLVDYGNASTDDDVPIKSYEWIGEELYEGVGVWLKTLPMGQWGFADQQSVDPFNFILYKHTHMPYAGKSCNDKTGRKREKQY
ncbi:hypothetical protein BDV27DRAFT_163008 [Aspergillus caelatus]|uniref:Uncharacterized protein n=1 Tax=Aspergillus caelatus TaxID=61420 RepID=A0A5N6ZNM0_9EURO|nr:uncharacterized protein BDV27DRAFT_163008 [Aspergillus caelatus]KAE8359045.1 hypothetical protein BDV27DRAFT_163008 [Aspergillus caelatus]